MNKVYRIIRNTSASNWVAVSEAARERGKRGRRACPVMAVSLMQREAAENTAEERGRCIGIMDLTFATLVALTSQYAFAESGDTVVNIHRSDLYSSPAATQVGDIAIGQDAKADSLVSTGDHAAVAVGFGAQALNKLALAFGMYSKADGEAAVATGYKAEASGTGSLAIGRDARSAGLGSIVIGAQAEAFDTDSMALGRRSRATLSGSVALGAETETLGRDGVAIGRKASVGDAGTNSIALGSNSQATAADAVALGFGATAGRSAIRGITDPLAYGTSTVTTTVGEVSVGAAGNERQITNVAAGTQDTDAVNVAQVKAVKNAADGNAKTTAAALGGGAAYDNGTGQLSKPSYKLDGGKATVDNVGGALSNLDGRTTQNTTNITNLQDKIDGGSIGLVQQDATSKHLTVGKDTDGTEVSLAGKGGNRKLTHVAAGTADTDAANVGQLKQSGTINRDGTVASVVTYDSADKAAITLGQAGKPVQIKNVAEGTEDSDAVNLGQLKKSGMVNPDGTVANVVTYDDDTRAKATLGGKSGTTLTNVAAGTLSASSTDAVNGSQLYATNQAMASALGATLGANGAIVAPTFAVGGKTYTNVSDAFKNLDGRVFSLEEKGGGAGARFDGNGGGNGSPEAANASGSYATASGANAVASGANATAAGAHAAASAANSVALGANSVADRANTVSVGSATQQRAIANVMAGTQDTDAVNVAQLNTVKSQVADVQQSISSLQSQTDQRINQMDTRMNRLGAMNAAMSTMVASAAGLQSDNRMAIGTGLYRGQAALAIGYQRKLSERATVTIGGATAGRSEYNVGVAAGFGW